MAKLGNLEETPQQKPYRIRGTLEVRGSKPLPQATEMSTHLYNSR